MGEKDLAFISREDLKVLFSGFKSCSVGARLKRSRVQIDRRTTVCACVFVCVFVDVWWC